ncbi:MAG: choice-of-anchor D domain-containing protein [Bacteroidota bacterium]|nr:choice-of-anchor D domain-containing protein [Bacteroidota bacterium]MDP4231926.1 choice-of-anchor D domain-containing protein [Bacteroidota bacterium]MDP4241367.1 choice-of-anchor D domain-containing protein [Bacteroidota bacterium]MDP4287290.1 choice-of-anchor D domain-containing protein [Bacteroidota bacterium]
MLIRIHDRPFSTLAPRSITARYCLALHVLLIASTLWAFDIAAQSHWQKVNAPFAGSPYFLNPDTGFLYASPGVASTTDGGKAWTSIPFFAQIAVSQLYFQSRTRGFASAVGIGPNGYGAGLYETRDGGITWVSLKPPKADYTGVHAVGDMIFASAAIRLGGRPLYFSSDDGASWNSLAFVKGLNLPANSQFQQVYGNRDSLVATVCYSQNGPINQVQIIYSTDLGTHWSSQNLGTSTWWMMALHIQPHACSITRQYVPLVDSRGDVYSFLKSEGSDYSVWDSTLMHQETGAWIAGDACAFYLCGARASPSFFRSTDAGTSWQPLTGGTSPQVPTFVELDDMDFQNLSVVGYGAVVYACDLEGSLWKTTDGGDGALSSKALAPKVQFNFLPGIGGSPNLTDSTCQLDSVVISYQSLTCAYAQIDSIWQTGLDANEYVLTSAHYRSCEPMPDLSRILITPKVIGTRTITVYARFIDDEFETFNDSLQFAITVSPSHPGLTAKDKSFAFGTIRTCGGVRDTTVTLTNTGCLPDTITNVTLGNNGFAWLEDSLPIIVPEGKSAHFRFRFLPTDSGVYVDTAAISVTSMLATTEQVALRGNCVQPRLSCSSSMLDILLDTTKACSLRDSILVFRNTGCDTITIDSNASQWSPGWSAVDPPFPLVLAPDSSFTVRVHFAPKTPGNSTQYITYFFDAVGKKDVASQRMRLTTMAVPGTGILDVPSMSLKAGSFSFCVGDTTVYDTIKNTGCDTLLLSKGQLQGDATFTLLTPLPSQLAPDSVAIISIHFSPRTKGAHAAQLLFDSHSLHGGDTVRKTAIAMSGTGLRGTMMLACDKSTLDLGTTPICQERDTFVVIQNTGCDTVCDSSVTLQQGTFQLAKPWSARCLAPGERDTVWLVSRLDTNGHAGQNLATLTIASNADTALPPITLTREIQYPAPWHLTISAPDSAYAGKPITYRLIQSAAADALPTDVTAIDFVLHYDDNLLEFEHVDEPFVLAGARGQDGRATRMPIHIAPVPTDSVLATLHFSAFLAPNQHTKLSVDGITFSSQPARPSDCIALAQVDTSAFTLRTTCGSDEITRELTGLPLTVDAVVPNPSHNEVTLYYSLTGSETIPATIMLEDALGRTWLSQIVQLDAGVRQRITLEFSGVASGVYNVRLASPTIGASVAKRIVRE